jgi:hypothetical protein
MKVKISKHAAERMNERGLTKADVLETLNKPEGAPELRDNGTVRYRRTIPGRGICMVAIDVRGIPTTGTVIVCTAFIRGE